MVRPVPQNLQEETEKNKLKKLKFDDITILKYSQLVGRYHKESPRGATILAASYVEMFLDKYL